MLARFVRNEEHSEGRDGNNDDGHSCFSLQPEYHPCGVYLAMAGITASNSHNGCDHGEDAEAKNGPERKFAAHVDANLPEEDDWDGDDWFISVYRRHSRGEVWESEAYGRRR